MIILKQYTNHQIHIDILPTEKFKTTMITFKFMAPLDYETITARSLLSKVLVRATKNGQQINHLINNYQSFMELILIALFLNLKINMSLLFL